MLSTQIVYQFEHYTTITNSIMKIKIESNIIINGVKFLLFTLSFSIVFGSKIYATILKINDTPIFIKFKITIGIMIIPVPSV